MYVPTIPICILGLASWTIMLAPEYWVKAISVSTATTGLTNGMTAIDINRSGDMVTCGKRRRLRSLPDGMRPPKAPRACTPFDLRVVPKANISPKNFGAANNSSKNSKRHSATKTSAKLFPWHKRPAKYIYLLPETMRCGARDCSCSVACVGRPMSFDVR